MAAVERVESEVGGIGILVNNAGWDRMMNFVDTDPTFWRKVIDINLVGHLNLHHGVLPRMVARRSGRVINIASDAGRVGSSGEAVYSACKGGMIAFAKTIAREHARHGIGSTPSAQDHADAAFGVLRRRHARRREARGAIATGHSAAPAGPAGRLSGASRFPRQQRRRVHHRADHFGFGGLSMSG